MVQEKDAVINYIASTVDIHLLASDVVDLREEIDNISRTMIEKDAEINRLYRENEMLHELVQTLSRAISGKE